MFKLPKGTYTPQVMFFGMTNASAMFQRTMDRIFAVLKNKYPGCIFVYMDDILIATPDDEELHVEIVNAVLDMLAAEDFFLKLSKCSFHQRTVDYLGIRIEGGIICIDPTKCNGLATWKEVLDDMHDVRSTLGLFGYNCPFIKGYAHIVRLVQQLTKKDVPFIWTLECTQAIRTLKAIVSADPVLRCPNHKRLFELEVDALQYALGAILYQRNDGGKLQAVGYYSQTLNPAERNYDVYDRELLAVIRALAHWRHLLLGAKHQVVVWTDHNNLTFYRHPQTISSRVARYIPRMAEYDLVLKHKPGTLNRADYLSRLLGVD